MTFKTSLRRLRVNTYIYLLKGLFNKTIFRNIIKTDQVFIKKEKNNNKLPEYFLDEKPIQAAPHQHLDGSSNLMGHLLRHLYLELEIPIKQVLKVYASFFSY